MIAGLQANFPSPAVICLTFYHLQPRLEIRFNDILQRSLLIKHDANALARRLSRADPQTERRSDRAGLMLDREIRNATCLLNLGYGMTQEGQIGTEVESVYTQGLLLRSLHPLSDPFLASGNHT